MGMSVAPIPSYSDLPEAQRGGSGVVNAMSVDVEDYYQVSAFETVVPRNKWATFAPRVESNTERVLELFERANIRATFFVLGCIAERHPTLIRRIVERGHELASHGYEHRRASEQTPATFVADAARTRNLLEDISGTEVKGYRAASFSINRGNWWAFEGLVSAGYTYSSSVNPIRHDHYGEPSAPRHPFKPWPHEFIEIPITTIDVAGRRFSCGGGGFFRLLPYRWSHWAISRVNRREIRPAIFYFHPWEIDPDQPRIEQASPKSRLRHYTNLGIMKAKVERVLQDFRWGRIDDVFLGLAAGDLKSWPEP
jgi:polysaccharide deacetylase family protein (PEP-CTERM system associated)